MLRQQVTHRVGWRLLWHKLRFFDHDVPSALSRTKRERQARQSDAPLLHSKVIHTTADTRAGIMPDDAVLRQIPNIWGRSDQKAHEAPLKLSVPL